MNINTNSWHYRLIDWEQVMKYMLKHLTDVQVTVVVYG